MVKNAKMWRNFHFYVEPQRLNFSKKSETKNAKNKNKNKNGKSKHWLLISGPVFSQILTDPLTTVVPDDENLAFLDIKQNEIDMRAR